MFNIETPNTINQIKTVFHGFGMWDVNERTTSAPTKIKLFHLTYYTAFLTSIVVEAFSTNNPDDSVFLSACAIILSVHAVRMFYIMFRKSEILHLINALGTHSTTERKEFFEVNKKLRMFTKLSNTFVSACTADLVFLSIFPAISGKKMIVNIAFPFQNGQSSYWMKHAFIILGCIYPILCFFLSIIILYLLVSCAIKYETLGNQLKSIGVTTGRTDEKIKLNGVKTENHKFFIKDLIDAVNAHRKINE